MLNDASDGHRAGTRFDLDELARARRLRAWMYDQYREGASGRAAEIGPGLGTFSERLLSGSVDSLHLVEPDPAFADMLERRFGGDPRVTLAREGLPDAPSLRNGQRGLDFILCQNVLEHVEDDGAALATLADALGRDGRLSLIVPAGPRLYGSLDESYGHFRRYTPASLRQLVRDAGLELADLRAFNLLGMIGWWSRNFVGATSLGAGSLRTYEQLLRVWRPLEDRLRPPIGLSLVAHARR
jgi:SAM-dependent methyltransferase